MLNIPNPFPPLPINTFQFYLHRNYSQYSSSSGPPRADSSSSCSGASSSLLLPCVGSDWWAAKTTSAGLGEQSFGPSLAERKRSVLPGDCLFVQSQHQHCQTLSLDSRMTFYVDLDLVIIFRLVWSNTVLARLLYFLLLTVVTGRMDCES